MHSGKQEKVIRLINAQSLDLSSSDEAAWSRVSTAILKNRVSLKEDSAFSAKFTISMPDACINENLAGSLGFAGESGGDGIAFIITSASTVKGCINTGMGYYNIPDSLVVELDSYFNGAYCNFNPAEDSYVNWAYDNQVYANKGLGYLQAVADDTRNKGIEYGWSSNGTSYLSYLNNCGYASLPDSQDRRFDHVGVMLDGETREHYGISYLDGIKPDVVKNGKYVNINDSSASTPDTSPECATRFADEGDIDVPGEGVDNRLFTIWVEYNGEDLFVRYANGSFSEAVRPEVPQIALEGMPRLAQKFANEDVSIGFVSSISDTGSAASHTIHDVAFANTYIGDGITAEYIYNTKLAAAKEIVQGCWDGIAADATKKDIQDTIDNVLDKAGIAGVTVTAGDITKTEPTTSAEGKMEVVILFECGTISSRITMDKTIEKLPATETPMVTQAPTVPPVAPTTPAAITTPVPPVPPTETPAVTTKPTLAPLLAITLPATETPVPTVTPTPGVTIKPTEAPAATEIPVPAVTPVPTVSPTAMPAVTLAPAPQDTPVPPAVTPLPPVIPLEEQEKNALFLNAGLEASQTGQNISVKWGAVPEADGYDVYVQHCGKKFTKKPVVTVKKARTTKVAVRKVNGKALDLKKNYKVYVLAYKLADGKKITLAKTITAHIVGKNNKKYTNAKAVKLKKSSYTLKKGKKAKILADTVLVEKGKKQITNAHAKEFRYACTDKNVAVVSAKGIIKAVGKGKCIIYVYARNGFAEKIKITVK